MRTEIMRKGAISLFIFGVVTIFVALFHLMIDWSLDVERGGANFLHAAQEDNIFMTTMVRGAYQEEDEFIMEVLRFAYDEEVADVSYHETDIVIKTVKGFVVTRRFPEIQFIRGGTDVDKAIIWWYGGQEQWVEKWKKIVKQKEKEMKEAKKRLDKERKK